jgi:hypothetical protein
VAALGEIAVEGLFLYYLSRERIRSAFRRS